MSYFRTLVRKRGVYLSLAALVTARLLLVSSYGDWLDLCVVDRAVEKLPPVNSFVIPIRDSLLHNFTVATLWMLLVLFIFTSPKKGAAIFLVSFVSLWFHLTYWFLLLVKGWLDDATCSFGRFIGQPNSISGHYCYFTFCFLSLTSLFQVKQLYWRDSRRGKQLKATLLWILENYISKLFLYTFIIGSIVTVYRTFFHGYHSLRQILYGLGLGCLSHALMETVLWEYFIAGRHVLLILGILALLSPNLLFFCTLFWPFPVYGYPVGSKQVMGHIINWLILFISRNAWTNALHPMKRGRHKDRSSLREQHIQDILKANDEKK
ncbi:uncharacterized protein Gasu_45400 [Galdieria sulphuraria]|uniref:Uncharacterized protein n=1 Tax=Galdieria sulphuraria TaxID=130081 RepID=M2WV89_GALSU|nr:uncharacterized protein Gasu_45400 [Galdieria sulphuraria]EME27875.1 hypothetical protein Gasu_45400 [Galdieria sulphuraria]|eukprot:XP_005704395.1 hypothetical protein Gasu_45400 [Galdieria sulphuraria]